MDEVSYCVLFFACLSMFWTVVDLSLSALASDLNAL